METRATEHPEDLPGPGRMWVEVTRFSDPKPLFAWVGSPAFPWLEDFTDIAWDWAAPGTWTGGWRMR